jgi:hypothetical protein
MEDTKDVNSLEALRLYHLSTEIGHEEQLLMAQAAKKKGTNSESLTK